MERVVHYFLRSIKKEKTKSVIKWALKEAFSGLVVAAAVAIATMIVNQIQMQEKEKTCIEKLHLGLNQRYIDEIMGMPMVQFYDTVYNADISIYKMKNSVVWCAYSEEQMVAYVIIAKSSGNLYKIDSNSVCVLNHDEYLTKFRYDDIDHDFERYESSLPVNNDDYAYYCELYYGAGPADYNFCIFGNYKCTYGINKFYELLLCENAENPQEEVERVRRKVKPNAFGMIKNGYENVFTLIPASDNLRTYNDALFGDWR